MSGSVRDNTGDLVQNGESLRLRIGGKADTGSAGTLIIQSGNDIFKGSTKLTLRTWHHVMVSSDGRTINLYLDGNPQAEVVAPFSEKRSNEWTFGGTLPFEGRIDEASWFSKTLTGEDAKRHYTASGMIPPPRPVPPRPKFKRGTMSHYQKAIIASKPAAYWPLQESAKDQGFATTPWLSRKRSCSSHRDAAGETRSMGDACALMSRRLATPTASGFGFATLFQLTADP